MTLLVKMSLTISKLLVGKVVKTVLLSTVFRKRVPSLFTKKQERFFVELNVRD